MSKQLETDIKVLHEIILALSRAQDDMDLEIKDTGEQHLNSIVSALISAGQLDENFDYKKEIPCKAK